MVPETGYPIKTSSNRRDKEGLSDDQKEPWTSGRRDKEPTVTITIDKNEIKYIKELEVGDTDNVEEVNVIVKDQNGNKVSCKINTTFSLHVQPVNNM